MTTYVDGGTNFQNANDIRLAEETSGDEEVYIHPLNEQHPGGM